MVQELDTVVITRDLPERGIVAGDIGPGRNPDGLLLGSAAYPLERGVTRATRPLESA